MTTTTVYSEVLVLEHCFSCGIPFGLPRDYRDQRLEDHGNFCCPNGHHQHYVGKTKAQKLQEEVERKDRLLAAERSRRDQAVADAEHQRNRVKGYQGALGKAKKRAARGVCPAPGCKRSFVDVARHVSTCHPDFSPEQADA